ncbi:MAG: ChaN family lipoprotein [Planctomycetes bacterium]|nr:ChaN family lipoprotein [Planctomycetota bacterium]
MPRHDAPRQPKPRSLLPAVLTVLAMLPIGSCGELAWSGGPAGPADDLARYRATFAAAVGTKWTGSMSTIELHRRLQQARVLWLGDDHRDSALHARQRRLLRELRAGDVRMVLGLEALGTDDMPFVDDWLAGRSSLQTLQRRMRHRWPASWLEDGDVDGEHFRTLLLDSKSAGEPVFALEPTPRLPLAARDAVIARAVQQASANHRDRLVVVVVGQTHLLGDGNLIGRTELPGIAIGALPPPAILDQPPTTRPGHLVRSGGDLWFFADLLPLPR